MVLIMGIIKYDPYSNTRGTSWKYLFYVLIINQVFLLIDKISMLLYRTKKLFLSIMSIIIRGIVWVLMYIGYRNDNPHYIYTFVALIVIGLIVYLSNVICYKNHPNTVINQIPIYLNYFLHMSKVFERSQSWTSAFLINIALCVIFTFGLLILVFKFASMKKYTLSLLFTIGILYMVIRDCILLDSRKIFCRWKFKNLVDCVCGVVFNIHIDYRSNDCFL